MTERYLDDFVVGQVFGSGTVRVDADRLKSFAAEFDPQPFHLDPEAARHTVFQGLAASGWHTAALTMKLLVGSELRPAGGIIGLGFEEFRWPDRFAREMSCRWTSRFWKCVLHGHAPSKGC